MTSPSDHANDGDAECRESAAPSHITITRSRAYICPDDRISDQAIIKAVWNDCAR